MFEQFTLHRRFILALVLFCAGALALTLIIGMRVSALRADYVQQILEHRTERVAFSLKEAAEDTRESMRDAAKFAAKSVKSDAGLEKVLGYYKNRQDAGGGAFNWKYLAWFDARDGGLYATSETDKAVFTPMVMGDLAADSAVKPYALIMGKLIFGSSAGDSILPAALTVQDGKGNTLGTLVTGLQSWHMATDALKRVSPDFAADIAILDDELFVISSAPNSVALSGNGDMLAMFRKGLGAGNIDKGASHVSALTPEKPKFSYRRLPELPFYIVAGVDGSQVFSMIWAPTALTCLAVLVFAGFSVLIGLYFRRRAILPLQELAQAAERIAEGKAPGAIPSAALPESSAVAAQLRKVVRYHKELRESRDSLEESHALVKSALRYITHELKTPLTQILGFSEILLNGAGKNLPESHKEYIRLIHEAARMQHTLIGSFTEQIREQEGGAEDLRAESCDLHEVTKYYVAIFAGRASDKNVRISVEADAELPGLYADQAKLGNVILNLASNAIKYNTNDGQVTFRIHLSRDGRYINLCCEDTGIGIEKEDIKKIFKPFTRLYTARTAHIDGAGLGLSYVRRIVAQHGGYVTVESEPGKGSRFTCHFPVTTYAGKADNALSAPKKPLRVSRPVANHDTVPQERPIEKQVKDVTVTFSSSSGSSKKTASA